MKKRIGFLLLFILIYCFYAYAARYYNLTNNPKYIKMNTLSNQTIEELLKNTSWNAQASVRIEALDKVIFIDPYHLSTEEKADVILITHSHGDHLSIEDIKKIYQSETVIYAPSSCREKLQDANFKNINIVEVGKSYTVNKLKFETVPAYTPTKQTHPKSNGWVGYVLDINGIKVYHPGDTERIPEMKNIDCDITFMPLGQTYTMNSIDDAVNAVLDVKAEIAIPFHYGMYEGTEEDAQKFKEMLEGKVRVIILNE